MIGNSRVKKMTSRDNLLQELLAGATEEITNVRASLAPASAFQPCVSCGTNEGPWMCSVKSSVFRPYTPLLESKFFFRNERRSWGTDGDL